MRFLTLLAALLFFSLPAAAEPPAHATARLFSTMQSMSMDSTQLPPLGVEITLEPGWHTYWRTPGDAGLAPGFDWTGSGNLASATALFPAPIRFTTADLDNFGYHEKVVFPIEASAATAGEAVTLNLRLDLLVCKDVCIPETKNLTLTIPSVDEPVPGTEADNRLYTEWMNKIPRPDVPAIKVEKVFLDYDLENKNYLVVEISKQASLPLPETTDVFVEHPSGLVFGRPKVDDQSGTKTSFLRMPIHSGQPLDELQKTLETGDIRLTITGADMAAADERLSLSPRPEGTTPPAPTIEEKIKVFDWYILFIALMGGLILNLMPCVLPVLSIKVLSVVSHGGKESAHEILRNFMASAAGILFSFWLIAAMLVSLKAAGQSIGWGIQFQHPAFLVFLIAILVLFAANMLGIFEIPLPRFISKLLTTHHEKEPTLTGHFLTGAFATLLATPCTAPFLGTAIGFALARGAFEIFVIFSFLGIGMALPYILLAFSPGLFRLMPKPGKWMGTMRRILSLALLATAGWLISILLTVAASPALDDGWQKFDQALIVPAITEGKTVIVDVTADWCLTCKANKKLVLEKKEVVEMLSAPNVLRLQADWTRQDQVIADYLKSFGKYGIPFNVVYGPSAPDGIVLPELLTREAVSRALIEAAGE